MVPYKSRNRLILGALLMLPVVACDRNGNAVGGTSGAPLALTETADLGTFSAPSELDAGPMADRLPAGGGRTILVPATDLFPGTARVDPHIINPYEGDAEAIAAGERHFEAFNCAGCHAPLGGGGMGPPLSDSVWIYGEEPAQIYLTIMHGRPDGMPAWGSMLPKKTVWELVSYIQTLDEIEDYAAEKGFEENVGGFRDTTGDEE